MSSATVGKPEDTASLLEPRTTTTKITRALKFFLLFSLSLSRLSQAVRIVRTDSRFHPLPCLCYSHPETRRLSPLLRSALLSFLVPPLPPLCAPFFFALAAASCPKRRQRPWPTSLRRMPVSVSTVSPPTQRPLMQRPPPTEPIAGRIFVIATSCVKVRLLHAPPIPGMVTRRAKLASCN